MRPPLMRAAGIARTWNARSAFRRARAESDGANEKAAKFSAAGDDADEIDLGSPLLFQEAFRRELCNVSVVSSALLHGITFLQCRARACCAVHSRMQEMRCACSRPADHTMWV